MIPFDPPSSGACWKRAGFLAITVLWMATSVPAHGQTEGGDRYTMMFRGVPLSKALVRIVETTPANLIYDSELVKGQRVYCSVESASVSAVLRCVLADAPIDFYQTSSGTYVLTRSPRQPPRRGHLTGRVVDAKTGEPLPDAHVLLAAANTGVATNPAGRFRLPDLTAGPHRVVATHVGYQTTATTVRVSPGDSTDRKIPLSPRSITTPPIVVTQSRRQRPEEELAGATLSAEDLQKAGTIGAADALDQASTLLGVHAQRPLADLHVQGGASGEHQVRLDGTPVRNPVTLRRMLGAFSPFGLDHLTVRKAGYGVEHGSAVSGVLDAQHALSTSSPTVGQLQIDPISANGEVHRSLSTGPNQSAQVRVAGRTSVWNAYRDPTLSRLLRNWNAVDPMLLASYFGTHPDPPLTPESQTSSLDFSDLHLAARADLGPYRSLRVSGYRGANRLRTEFLATSSAPPSSQPSDSEDGTAMLTQDRYAWTSQAAQAQLDWMLTPRASTSLQVRASEQRVHRGYQMSYLPSHPPGEAAIIDTLRNALDPARWPDDRNRIREGALKGTGSYSLSSRHHLKVAATVSRLSTQFRLGNRFFRPMTFTDTHWQMGGFVRDVYSLGTGTTVNAGTRLTYIPARRTLYAEPRLILRHEGTQAPLGNYTVRLAGGIYRQFVNRFDVSSTSPTSILPSLRFWLPITEAHAPPRAYHTTLSTRLQPLDRWTVTAESYLKRYPRLLALDYTAFQGDRTTPISPPSRALSSTHGSAAGIGLSLSRQGPILESTLRYEWSHARRQFPSRFDERLVPPPWNQPHRVQGSTRLKTDLGIELRLRGTYVSGQSWGFRRTYYDYLSTRDGPPLSPTPSFQNPGRHTLSSTVRVDAGTAYTLDLGPTTVDARITITNVLDRENPFDWGLEPSQAEPSRTTRYLPGRRLKGMLRIRY